MSLFSRFSKRSRAERANDRGRQLSDDNQLEAAIEEYSRASAIDPSWSVPFYNLGLLHKYEGNWAESLDANLRASELAPDDQAAWWNLGIAATALGRWHVARAAWRGAGLDIAEGEGPLDLPCGTSPIRLNPDDEAEVVWAHRLDPARARLVSIPLDDFCFGDIVLNDGAAVGHRRLGERNVPVFNCLALLEPSPFSTWLVEIELGDDEPEDAPSLELLLELALERDLAAEDWSTSITVLCKACSEGIPHDHDDSAGPRPPIEGPRRVAIAARSEAEARQLLDDWQPRSGGARIGALTLQLSRHD